MRLAIADPPYMLGYQPGDEVDDLFPGSGAVSAAMAVLL